MVHIKNKLAAVIKDFRDRGFNNVMLRVYPEDQEDWNENYGIFIAYADHYFPNDSQKIFWEDILEYLKGEFNAVCIRHPASAIIEIYRKE